MRKTIIGSLTLALTVGTVALAPPAAAADAVWYTFNTSDEGFTRDGDYAYADVSWDPVNGRIKVSSDRRIWADEAMKRSLQQSTTSTYLNVTARWSTTQQGNWQSAIPIFLANSPGSQEDIEGLSSSIQVYYDSRDANLGQWPRYYLTYKDAGGAQRINDFVPVPPNTEVRLSINYNPTTHVLTMQVRDTSGTSLLTSTYTTGTNANDGFTVNTIGVAADGKNNPQFEQPTIGWTDDITIETQQVAPPAITSSPPGQTASTSASFSFTGESGATFDCRLDGGTYSTCTSPKSYSGLSEATHTFDVRQSNLVGTTSSPASYTWTVDQTAPAPPSITSSPANPTSATNASFSFTGESGATFQCRLDGSAYATCTSPKSYTGLADGSHTFDARQSDGAGNTGSPASYTWTVDTTSPAAPTVTSAPANPTNQTAATFAFTGEPGATFLCRLDGGSFASCTSPKSYTGLSDTSHTFDVRQADPAGNTGPAATRTWTVDVTAPAAPSITFGPASPTNAINATFSFAGESGATFQCRLDGSTWASCTAPKTYNALANGSHTFDVRQTDPAGNTGQGATFTWTVDAAAPAPPTITSGPANPTNATSASLSFTGEAGSTFQCRIDAGTYATCTSPKSYGGLGAGSHTVELRQSDPAGNTSSPASYTWTIDLTAPSAPTITSGPANPTNATTATFGFTGESGATFQCRIDGGTYAACSSPTSYSGLGAGGHTVDVRQTDAAGNIGVPASYTFTVDLTAPAAPAITSSPTNPTASTSASFAFTGESGATFQCRVDGAAFASCTSPKAYAALPDGTHTFEVRQADVAGNVSMQAAFAWTVDTTGPAAPAITAQPADPSPVADAAFGFTGETGGSYECRVDLATFAACTSPKTYTGLADGTHTFQVRQVDAVGNAGTPASLTWTVDTTAPAAPVITSGPADPTLARNATLAFTGEAGAAFTCRLDTGAATACASPRSYAGLAGGSHTFAVSQTDVAGHTGPAATYTWTVTAQCADGIDNDGDGKVDAAADPGCASGADDREGPSCNPIAPDVIVCLDAGREDEQYEVRAPRDASQSGVDVAGWVYAYTFVVPNGPTVTLACVVLRLDGTPSDPCAAAGGIRGELLLDVVDNAEVPIPDVRLDGLLLASVGICYGELTVTVKGLGLNSQDAYTTC